MTTNATINKASFPIVFTASCSGRYTTVDVILLHLSIPLAFTSLFFITTVHLILFLLQMQVSLCYNDFYKRGGLTLYNPC